MAIFTWKEAYSVGIEEIDTQHKELIRIANVLFEAMKTGKGQEKLQVLLGDLLNYTIYHFKYEEGLLRKHSYSKYDNHIKEHADFTKKIQQLNNDIKEGKSVITIQVFTYVKQWLNDHILINDKQYQSELVSLNKI